MKYARILCILLILPILTPSVYAANEIRAFLPGVSNAYAMVREIDGDVWHVADQAFEVYGTDANTAADYDIAMVDKSGDMFVGDMDTNIGAGTYYVTVSNRVGAAPADTDPVLWYEYLEWSGSVVAEPTPGGIADAVWDEATSAHTTETTFGGELGGLDPNLTLVLADTNELQGDWTNGGRLDLLLDAVKAITDRLVLVTTTVASATDASNFVLTAVGLDANDVYTGCLITVKDVTDSHYETRMMEWYEKTKTVKLNQALGFTPAAGDNVWIWSIGYIPIEMYEAVDRMPYSTTVIDATGQTQQNTSNVIRYRTYKQGQ